MRIHELLEIDTGATANQIVQRSQQNLRTIQTAANRDLQTAVRGFIAAYRTADLDPTNLTRAVAPMMNDADRPATKTIVLTSMFETMRDAIPLILREVGRAGNQTDQVAHPGVNAQLSQIMRDFLENNATGDDYTQDVATLLAAMQQ